jgi:DNA-binding LacI/PurR family transcriptional regulator
VAFGVLDALAERNRPSLSSVAVPFRDVGRRAARLVLERAGGSTAPPVRDEFPTMLRPRETCGCPRPRPTA